MIVTWKLLGTWSGLAEGAAQTMWVFNDAVLCEVGKGQKTL